MSQVLTSLGKYLKTDALKLNALLLIPAKSWKKNYTNSDIAGLATDIWQNKLIHGFLLSPSFKKLVLALRTMS